MGYGALARVLTGWTGTIAYDDGTSVAVTPYTRESAASLIARLAHAVLVATGVTLTISVSSSGVITLTGTATFDLTVTSNTATRTGLTGSYTGATTYTAAGAYTGAYVPAYGLRLNGMMLATSRTSLVGDGTGGVSPIQEAAGGRLVVWDDEIGYPTLGDEHDVWHDGRLFGRVAIEGARLTPLSRYIRSTTTTQLELDVREVA